MADYNINAVTRRVVYTGSAGVGPYAFTFEILDDDDLAVYFNSTKLTKTTDYNVTINANGTGSVTLVVNAGGNVPQTPVASDAVIVVGARDIERTTDFVTAGDLLASSLNEQLDSLTIFDQQIAEENQRGMRAPPYDPALVEDGGTLDMTLPAKADRAGKTLQFNATTGNPEAGPTIDEVANAQTYANNAATSATASATSATAAASSATSAAASATSATTAKTAAETAETNAETAETNAETAETNAAASALTATTKASEASTSAANAATSETNAATSATNASTSEANAASSASSASSAQSAAESARDATLAAYDNFDDRYLGSKSSAPTLDNDGNALVAGALYFDTVAEAMYVYTGSAWVAAYVSGTGFLALTGGTMTGDINFGDNDKAIFGAGSDLQIYHDGSSSFIADVGTGNLTLLANEFRLNNSGNTENMITAAPDGAVTLFHNDSAKIATTATGVDVTGTVTATAFVSETALSNRNIIVNGAMAISQRSTSVSSVTSGGYKTCDRFNFGISGIGTYTITQSSDAPDGFANSLKVDCTTADASPTGSDRLFVSTAIEGQDVQHLKKGTSAAEQLTLSFWVKSNKTGVGNVNLRDSDNTRMVGGTYTINTANTWEYKTVTYPADTTGVLDNDNAVSLRVEWWLDGGSNYNSGTTPTAWEAESSTDFNASGTLDIADSTSNDWHITGVQLELGEQETPFEHRSFADDLAACQRYYQIGYVAATGKADGGTMGGAATFATSMRTSATMAVVSTAGAHYAGTPTLTGFAEGVTLTSPVNGTTNNAYRQIKFSAEAEL